MRALLADNRSIQVSPLDGTGHQLYAVVIESDRKNNDRIQRAATRFNLTRRQIEVLLQVLDGASAGEVAGALQISEYTAQGYIKALLLKTESRNRAAMVAKVLDWL